MTRFAVPRIACLALLITGVMPGCGGPQATADMRTGQFDASTLPARLQQPYAIFRVRCGKCHTLDRPLNAPITDPAHWDRYVARMRRMPGSGISPADASEILKFLYYLAALQRGETGDNAGAETTPPQQEDEEIEITVEGSIEGAPPSDGTSGGVTPDEGSTDTPPEGTTPAAADAGVPSDGGAAGGRAR